VGSRTNTETIVAILKAFLDRRTWKQADLARHVGVSAAAIRKRLGELQTNGVPLESEKDHPHVYWSVPKTWYPGGVLFTSEQVTQVLRLLSRVPASKARDVVVDSLIKALPNRPASAAVVPAESSAREQQHLPVVEDAANQNVVMRFSYFTANRGSETSRVASVQRVLLGPPARFVALCHRTGKLKWFRIDNMSDSKLEPAERFRAADGEQLDAYLSASLDGFHDGTAALEHVFFVREPEARWVARNLLDEMQCDEVPGGIRVTVKTSALPRLARYVVGLGAATKPLTPELEAEVATLAKGVLGAIATA
jgi:predicted DNA-binding transcriptional regulator YafY